MEPMQPLYRRCRLKTTPLMNRCCHFNTADFQRLPDCRTNAQTHMLPPKLMCPLRMHMTPARSSQGLRTAGGVAHGWRCGAARAAPLWGSSVRAPMMLSTLCRAAAFTTRASTRRRRLSHRWGRGRHRARMRTCKTSQG
eukprot:78376-Chlamydomonas_euryale.AAC.11